MKRVLAALLLAGCCTGLTSCATTHAVRWTYKLGPNVYGDPDEFSEGRAIQATVGGPLILLSAAYDLATFPFQALFGVWPWWGDESLHHHPERLTPMVKQEGL